MSTILTEKEGLPNLNSHISGKQPSFFAISANCSNGNNSDFSMTILQKHFPFTIQLRAWAPLQEQLRLSDQ
ncbi:MAG: hypothetical protein IPI10_10625 [Bacteroidetes bacterium]|nr:hypothetical protein [Bacteroidota bacterium]